VSGTGTSTPSPRGSRLISGGHPRACRIFKDDDALVNKKLHKALAAGLNPILCIGETKDEYEAGLNKMVSEGRCSNARAAQAESPVDVSP
jgi:triosephosphate isomerase